MTAQTQHGNTDPPQIHIAEHTRRMARHILQRNGHEILKVGQLMQIRLPSTRSGVVQQNGGVLYGCLFYGLEGLFRKDHPDTLAYGRHLCDQVRTTFDCHGFFTSDELPRYGVNRAEMRDICMHMEKKKLDGNLIVLCAYQEVVAARIRAFLIAHFRQEIEAP